MAYKISLCIPTYNRFETFLAANLDRYLNNPYIDEIVVVDDASDDYSKLLIKYGPNHEKIRLFQQEINQGSFKNKVRAASLAKNDWICLMDSDNYADERYFEPLLHEWNMNGQNEQMLYSATFAAPHFKVNPKDLPPSNIITKDVWYQTHCLYLNIGNLVFHKSLVPFLQLQKYHEIDCCAICSKYLSWIGLRHGFTLKFVPNMTYDHVVHPESIYMQTSTISDAFDKSFSWSFDDII